MVEVIGMRNYLGNAVADSHLLIIALAVVCVVLAALLCVLVFRWFGFIKELSEIDRKASVKKPRAKTTVKGSVSGEEIAVITAAINMYYHSGFCVDDKCQVIVPQFRVKKIKKIK